MWDICSNRIKKRKNGGKLNADANGVKPIEQRQHQSKEVVHGERTRQHQVEPASVHKGVQPQQQQVKRQQPRTIEPVQRGRQQQQENRHQQVYSINDKVHNVVGDF